MKKKTPNEVIIIETASQMDSIKDEDKIIALQSLQHSIGWKIILHALDINIDYLGDLIINKIDDKGKKLTEDELDQARFKRLNNKELKTFPDELIKKFTPRTENTQKTYDPYYSRGDVK